MNLSVWMPLLAVELGAGAEGFGWLMSALGIGSLTGALGVAFFGRTMGRRALLIAPVLFGVFEVGLAALAGNRAPMTLVLPAATITGFAVSTTMSMSNTTIQSLVPNALRGRVSSIFMTVFMGSVPIGALISGTTSSLFGTPGSVAFGGTVVLVSGVIAAIYGFGHRPRLAAAPARPANTVPASSVPASSVSARTVPPRSGAGGDD